MRYAVCLSSTALIQLTSVCLCPCFISNRSTAMSKSMPASAGERFPTVKSIVFGCEFSRHLQISDLVEGMDDWARLFCCLQSRVSKEHLRQTGFIFYLMEHCVKAWLASKSKMQDLNLSKRALSWLRRPCERGTASESTPFLFALLSVIPMSCTHTTCWHSRYHLKGSKSLHTIPQFACCEVPLKSQAEYQAA